MDKRTFNAFREMVYDLSGISLGPGKEALVSARIGKRIRALGLKDHRDYLKYLHQDGAKEEIVHLVDAISTNVTSFFRENVHFEFLQNAVKTWLGAGQRRFRFWSAACSSGEEPYSLAMTLLESFNGHRVDAKILATDISTKVLSASLQGTYEERKLGTVPASMKRQYFTEGRDGDQRTFTVAGMLKDLIVFRRLNLSQPPFPMTGPLDAILCRNVMIYFDN